MNLVQELTKFARRYRGTGRDSFSLSRPANMAKDMIGGKNGRVEMQGGPELTNPNQVRDARIFPPEQQPPTIEAKPIDRLRSEIERRENKDFSKGGADYDTDHDWKDVLRAGGLGVAKGLANADPRLPWGTMLGQALGGFGGGAIGGAFDPNADEKLGNELALEQLYPKYEQQFKRTSAETNQRLGEAEKLGRIQDRETDNARLGEKAKNDAEIAKRKVDLQEQTLDWKKEDRDRYFELEDIKQKAKDSNNERMYNLAVKRQLELERNNKATEAGRNARAQMSQTGQDRRAQLNNAAKSELERFKAAQKSGDMAAQAAAREALAKLKAELDAGQ